jgi:hypothetical protein
VLSGKAWREVHRLKPVLLGSARGCSFLSFALAGIQPSVNFDETSRIRLVKKGLRRSIEYC